MPEDLTTIMVLLLAGYALGLITAFSFITNANGRQPIVMIQQDTSSSLGCLGWLVGFLIVGMLIVILLFR